jgi:TetR/AcrR family tetracycline transcriptional repressor
VSGAGAKAGRRDDIVAVALDLLDAHGLAELSMRRIAGALGVQPSALYWHFTDKQTLLGAVAAVVLGTPEASGPEALALDLRDRLLARRDAAELVSSASALGHCRVPHSELLRSAALAAGADERAAAAAASAVVLYTLGWVLHAQQRSTAESLGAASPDASEPAPYDDGLALIFRGL